MNNLKSSILLVSFLFVTNVHAAEKLLKKSYHSPDNWRRTVAPFQIADHTWYIGTEGLAALLIKTKEGAILVDGGIPDAAKFLLKNMKDLGVSPKNLKWIVYSHAHLDHAGPLAEVKKATGAKVAANAESAVLMSRGGENDIHFGSKLRFKPFTTDRFLMDGETIELGEIKLTVHFTPAHTPGSHSWTWTDTKDGKPLNIAYVDSLSAPDYKLVNNPRYPHIIEDFRKGIARVRTLPCDLLITPHPEASGWTIINPDQRHSQPMSCAAYADKVEAKINNQIKEQTK